LFISLAVSCTEPYSLRSNFLKAFGEPYFDYGLASNPQTTCLPIKGIDHPGGKIHIDSTLFLKRPPSLGQIQNASNILTLIE
jgi:hypothetical protein